MADITDDELDDAIAGGINADSVALMLRGLHELQRRRAEQVAGREHVERVVKEVYDAVFHDDGVLDDEAGDVIARRVADRLSVPRKPSLASRRKALGMRELDEAERRDLLAANIAGREHVERVVRGAVMETERTAVTAVPIHRIDDIVRRAADRLSAPELSSAESNLIIAALTNLDIRKILIDFGHCESDIDSALDRLTAKEKL